MIYKQTVKYRTSTVTLTVKNVKSHNQTAALTDYKYNLPTGRMDDALTRQVV